MTRVFNFSAGPAALPEPVLRQAAEEMLDWHGSGMSVMEMSHRGKEFIEIQGQAEADLRALMGIPANYKVLFLQGGASLQFSMVPLNLLPVGGKADYVLTGSWAKKAASEAKRYGTVNVAATSAETNFNRIPTQAELKLDPGAAYVHITGNNTIFGTEYHYTPDTGAVPLVNDASSNILSRPVDVSKYGLIYGGAQKNIGPAGLTIVIVREDLLGHALPVTPSAFNYQLQAEADSMYNTPPTYAIYIAGLVFEWIEQQGGLAGLRVEQEAGHAPDRVPFHHHLALAGDGGEQVLLRVVQAADQVGGAAVHEARGEALVQRVAHRVLGGAGLVLEARGVAHPIGAGGDVGPDADGGEPGHQGVEVALDVAQGGDLPGHPLVRQRAVLEAELAASVPALLRLHVGRADIGMAGERHLGLGREDAHLG